MLENFFIFGAIPANAEKGTYIPLLVLASYIVASFGSYAGLTLATQIAEAETGQKKRALHWTGAFALGAGIWSMHFIGMLAYKMRMTVQYDPLLTILSLLVAVVVAYFALQITQAKTLSLRRIVISAVLLGIGICAMHYTGMAAMQMRADLRYIPSLFLLSVAIAITAAGAALWIIFTLGRHSGRWKIAWMIIAALVMGVAICGMHYTGMAAAIFIPFADCRFDSNQSFELLAIAVIASTTILLFILTFAISRRLFLTVGCGALFMLPLVIIVYQATTSLNSNIQIAEKEQYGVYYHAHLVNIFERLQEVRGLTYVVRSGDAAFSSELQSKKESLSTAVAEADDADHSYKNVLTVTQDWQKIRSSIMSLLESGDTRPPIIEFRQYSEAISSLISFMGNVADNSSLSIDPQLNSNYLAIASIHIVPKIMETLGKTRGLTAGLLGSGKTSSQWTREEIEELHGLYNELHVQDDDFLEDALHRAERANPSSKQFVEYHNQSIEPKVGELQENLEKIIFDHTSNMSAAGMFKLGTDTIALYDTLYERISNGFLDLLKQRQKDYTLKRDMVLYSSLVAFLGFIALFVFLYRNLTKTERAKQEATLARQKAEKETQIVTLLRSVASAANTAQSIEGAIERCLELACDFMQWPVGHAYVVEHKQNLLLPTNLWHINNKGRFKALIEITAATTLKLGKGLPGRVWESLAPAWIADLSHDPNFPRGQLAANLGVKSGFAIPIVVNGRAFYVLEFFSERIAKPDEELLSVMKDIGAQLARVIERIHAQNALEEAREIAEIANNTKSEFLANMSHELRTPLNSILGMLRLLKESKLAEEEYHLADTAFRSSVNLLDIVNDILDLSKIEAGEMHLEHIGMDLAYILKSVVHALEHTAKEKGISINRYYEKEQFSYVLGDPTRLTRILVNLIGNAIKYTDTGHIDVRAIAKRLDDKHVEFRCDIMDTGIGIPKEKQQSVFEKFVQADTTTTRKYGGTGLGLAITKQLVELMGGTIGLESEVGAGSTFWFTIPFEVTDKLSERKYTRKIKMHSGTISPEKARILIAEDHPTNQILITKLMKRFNIGSYEIVESGIDVVERCHKTSWDVVLMDCHMPGKSGYDATKDIRDFEKETGAHVPIIAMTANAMAGDREKCLRYGMDEYISKPINIDELKEVLGQWVCFEDKNGNGKTDQSVSPTDAPLDLSVIKEFSEGDVEMEKQLMRAYVTQSDKNMKVLAENRMNAGATPWREAAHMFKGGSSGIGAKTLSELCDQAQLFQGTVQEQAALFEKIDSEYNRLKDHLKKIGLLS